MLISDTKEKILIFKSRHKLTYRKIAKELDISEVHLSRVIQGKTEVSNSLHSRIEQMFRRYEFLEALDKKGRL